MTINQINEGINLYSAELEEFSRQYGLPKTWFYNPDHYAIKCADEADYLETCHAVGVLTEDRKLLELEEGGRLLASGTYAGRITLAGFGFSMVEIMQPRPGKEGEEGYVEHTEFTFPDFFVVEEFLRTRGIEYERQSNPGHAWINIPISEDRKMELKVNDKPLEKVVLEEQLDGLLTERKF